jgi:hypothetical protein
LLIKKDLIHISQTQSYFNDLIGDEIAIDSAYIVAIVNTLYDCHNSPVDEISFDNL